MAKRFFATEIWSEEWFLSMDKEYKLFYYYLLSNCNHAGIYKVNTKTFNLLNKSDIKPDEIISNINNEKDRIIVLNKTTWFIPDFFVFQYSDTFNINNRVHESVYFSMLQFDLNLTSIRGLKLDKSILTYNSKHKKYGHLIDFNLTPNRPQIDPTYGAKDKDKDNTVITTKKDAEKKIETNGYSGGEKSNLEVLNEVKTYNHNDLLAFYMSPYLARTPEFKAMYSEILYARYQKLCDLIIHTYPNIRCNFMITIAEFKKIAALHTDEEIEGGLQKLSSSGNIKPDSLLHLRLAEYIAYSIRDKEKPISEKGRNKRENFN